MQWRTVLLVPPQVVRVRPSSLISSFRLEQPRGLLHTEPTEVARLHGLFACPPCQDVHTAGLCSTRLGC